MKARRSYKRKGKASQKHVRLYRWLTDSPAWLSLPSDARAAYIELGRIYDGANNGFIGLGVRELGERLNITKNKAGRAMALLQDRGFVVCTEESSFDRKTRTAREWRLTEHDCDRSGQAASKDFMKWRPKKTNNSTTSGTDSTTTDTVGKKKTQKVLSQYHQRDREHINSTSHSTTTDTHIVNHTGGVHE